MGTYRCVHSTLATDALVLRQRLNRYWLNIHYIGPASHRNVAGFCEQGCKIELLLKSNAMLENKITFLKEMTQCV